MTTNHYDRLDPALIRPGRVDIHEVLDDAHGEQAERLFRKFYGSSTLSRTNTNKEIEALPRPGEPDAKERVWREGEEVLGDEEIIAMGAHVREVVDTMRKEGKTVSMASLQGLFIRSGAREASELVAALCKPSQQ